MVHGCRQSTAAHAVMAEAGLAPVAVRCTSLAARLLAKTSAPPEGDLLRRVAEADSRPCATVVTSSVTGWRGVGREA